MKKNIYLIQPTYMNSSSVHFPYAIGALASYAWNFKDISDNYDLKKVFFLRENISDIVNSLEKPFLIGFSNYIWNFEYNKVLAKRIKEIYPECKIVFGGPQISEDSGIFDNYPYIDILMYYEGEVAFRDLLRAFACNLDFNDVCNISYKNSDGKIISTKIKYTTVAEFPSPYESGFFDRLCSENPDIDFIPLIETNRGCPNNCSYCSWGKIRSKVRLFPMSRVFSDIEWVSRHKMEFLGFADANFGLFPRDEEIVDKIIQCYKDYGYPKKFQVSYSKDSGERVFNITKKLNDNGMDKGVTLSFQSMSEIVQQNIGRPNMNINHYKSLLKKYLSYNIPTYTDLILGLPGETLDSFKNGIDELLEQGQHTSLFVHLCEWLPLSEMGKESYIKKYKIKYSKIPLNQPHRSASLKNDIQEYSRIVTSTYSMTSQEWKAMVLFSTCVLCFHHLGLLQLIGLYLHYENGVKYSDFYSSLLQYMLEESEQIDVFKTIKKRVDKVIDNGDSVVVFDDIFGDVAWPFEEYAFLKIVSSKDAFYKDVSKFIERYIPDDELRADLIEYQKFAVKTINVKTYDIFGNYDWKIYFDNLLIHSKQTAIKQKNVHYRIVDENSTDNWVEYARKVLWYGRRGGKNMYLSEIKEVKD